MRRRTSLKIFILGIICILLNYIGRGIAEYFCLPIWMDSFGTVLMAYVLGPVCGCMVGVAGNILFTMFFGTPVLYALTSAAIGVAVGVCAKKGFMNSMFGVMSTAFVMTIFSAVISVPVNYILYQGGVGNIWGDSVSKYLQELGFNLLLCNIAAEVYMDFLDKVITILLLFAAICIVRRIRGQQKKQKNRSVTGGLLLIFLISSIMTSAAFADAKESENKKSKTPDFNQYIQTIYDGNDGFSVCMANDIEQTREGILFIGTYNGLYRYSGNTFEWMNEMKTVKTVNCLYTDESGRMWIGTNDNGISICTNQEIVNVVNHSNGLPSDSVHCITQASDGCYYVGTSGCLAILKLSNGLRVCDTFPEIMYAKSICADNNGNVATVSDKGSLYILRGTEIISEMVMEAEGESYTCCAFDNTGRLYAASSAGRIEIYQVQDSGLCKVSTIICDGIGKINSINASDEIAIFICADNGIGYLDKNNNFVEICTNFNKSVENMIVDYQGNLWFTSSRRGLLSMCPSVFTEINGDKDLSETIVNTVVKWQECMYFGTDNGLVTARDTKKTKLSEMLVEQFEKVRIRCLFVDSHNSMWICTSEAGIIEVSEDGKLRKYDSSTGAMGDKFRTVIEREDGTIVAAGDCGITYIRNGKVCFTLGHEDGLTNPKVLCLYERSDGSIFAGTDGNGIVVIKDEKIKQCYSKQSGLSSEVIIRMVEDRDGSGLFIVTSNGLCYQGKSGNIRMLDNFPYYNNYDLVEGKDGKLFVLGSSGIYIVDKTKLLNGDVLSYEFLGAKKGLRTALTPNSWNYMDEQDNLYMSGNVGVVCMNLNHYNISARSYRMLLQSIKVDGKTYFIEKGETVTIPREAEKIEITPEVVNYSVNDIDVSVYLEGYDSEAKVMSLTELDKFVYSGIPSGEYVFHIAVIESNSYYVMAENTYTIVKEKEMYDNLWFRIYMIVVAAIFIAYITWLFFRTQIQKTLRLQRIEIEQAKKQIQMGNETILTIAKTVDAKDENTSQHSSRVSEYSVMIAKRLGFDSEECERLRQTALLHDIGKIGIPDSVLKKPARLTDEEYTIMKSHVLKGAEILKNFTLIDNVEEGALYHHERYDGRGYVHGLKGEEIPLNARIIGIADAFDAMTANRVYRKKLDIDFVIDELKKGRGTQFDPNLVDIMLDLIEDGEINVAQLYDTVCGSEEQKGGKA